MIGGAKRRKVSFEPSVLWLVVGTVVFWAAVIFLVVKLI